MRLLDNFLTKDRRQNTVDGGANRPYLSITYFFYYGMLGIFVPYIAIFLDHRHFSSEQIGILLALVAVSRIIGPYLWANLADKTQKIAQLLRLSCLLAFVCFLFIFFVDHFIALVLVLCAMKMLWTSALPQLEVLAIRSNGSSKGGYGYLRLWGSIGFIFCTLFMGFLIDLYGAETTIMACAVALLMLYLSTIAVSNQCQAPQKQKEIELIKASSISSSKDNKHNIRRILTPVFIIFLVAFILLQASFGAYNNFFALYMHDLGYKYFESGSLIAVGVVAEILVFVYAASLMRYFNPLWLIAFSLFITVLRWLALAYFAQYFVILIVSQTTHALSFGLTHAAAIQFLALYFPSSFQNRAQALYLSCSFGIGGAIGSYISGVLWQQGEGAQVSFLVSAIVALIASILVMLMTKRSIKQV